MLLDLRLRRLLLLELFLEVGAVFIVVYCFDGFFAGVPFAASSVVGVAGDGVLC